MTCAVALVCQARQACLAAAGPYRDGLSATVHMEEQFAYAASHQPPVTDREKSLSRSLRLPLHSLPPSFRSLSLSRLGDMLIAV